MSKKVLVITGSYHKNGNTSKMAEAFIKGAKDSGNEVIKVDASTLKLLDCKGCNACLKKGNACSWDDDFNKVAEHLESCDTLVISAPMYWINLPANVRMIIDKLYAYGGAGGLRPLSIKESYLMICGGDSDDKEYRPLLEEWKIINNFLNWNNRSNITIGGIDDEGAIEKSGILDKIYELGKNV